MARKPNLAERRYLWRFWPAMALYVAAMVGGKLLFRHTQPSGLAAYAVAVVPALAIVAVIVAMGLYLAEETDEYLRLQQAKATLLGAGVTLSVATLWGFLEDFGLAPHAPAYWGFIVFCFAMGLARCVAKVRG
jgi:hypothetical protein